MSHCIISNKTVLPATFNKYIQPRLSLCQQLIDKRLCFHDATQITKLPRPPLIPTPWSKTNPKLNSQDSSPLPSHSSFSSLPLVFCHFWSGTNLPLPSFSAPLSSPSVFLWSVVSGPKLIFTFLSWCGSSVFPPSFPTLRSTPTSCSDVTPLLTSDHNYIRLLLRLLLLFHVFPALCGQSSIDSRALWMKWKLPPCMWCSPSKHLTQIDFIWLFVSRSRAGGKKALCLVRLLHLSNSRRGECGRSKSEECFPDIPWALPASNTLWHLIHSLRYSRESPTVQTHSRSHHMHKCSLLYFFFYWKGFGFGCISKSTHGRVDAERAPGCQLILRSTAINANIWRSYQSLSRVLSFRQHMKRPQLSNYL